MPAPLAVTLFRRAGCGLCDEAEAMLAGIGKRIPMQVSLVDIDSDPDLEARYFLEIPVVQVDGVTLAQAPISGRKLEDALAALAG